MTTAHSGVVQMFTAVQPSADGCTACLPYRSKVQHLVSESEVISLDFKTKRTAKQDRKAAALDKHPDQKLAPETSRDRQEADQAPHGTVSEAALELLRQQSILLQPEFWETNEDGPDSERAQAPAASLKRPPRSAPVQTKPDSESTAADLETQLFAMPMEIPLEPEVIVHELAVVRKELQEFMERQRPHVTETPDWQQRMQLEDSQNNSTKDLFHAELRLDSGTTEPKRRRRTGSAADRAPRRDVQSPSTGMDLTFEEPRSAADPLDLGSAGISQERARGGLAAPERSRLGPLEVDAEPQGAKKPQTPFAIKAVDGKHLRTTKLRAKGNQQAHSGLSRSSRHHKDSSQEKPPSKTARNKLSSSMDRKPQAPTSLQPDDTQRRQLSENRSLSRGDTTKGSFAPQRKRAALSRDPLDALRPKRKKTRSNGMAFD